MKRNNVYFSFFLLFIFTLPQCRTSNTNASGIGVCGGSNKTVDHNTKDRYRRMGLPECVIKHNVRDNTGQNTKDIHPVPG